MPPYKSASCNRGIKNNQLAHFLSFINSDVNVICACRNIEYKLTIPCLQMVLYALAAFMDVEFFSLHVHFSSHFFYSVLIRMCSGALTVIRGVIYAFFCSNV